VKLTDDGRLDLADLQEKVKGAAVLGLTMASNVLGTINPVAEAAAIAHQAGAKVVVDAIQAAPHVKIDVKTLSADAVAITGHKLLGPTGIGALWATEEVLAAMEPVYGGGEMIKDVGFGKYEPAEGPEKLEAGTMPVADAVGLAAAIKYVANLGMKAIREHEVNLNEHAIESLSAVPGVTIYGPPAGERVGLVAFTVDGVHPHDLATILDDADVAIRSGHHCAAPLHQRLGVPATARASWSVYSAPDEINRLVAGIKDAQRTFSR
jgi:cysteine desulfurase/selenocysteine lyase